MPVNKLKSFLFFLLIIFCFETVIHAQQKDVRIIPVGDGWAANSVNVTIFRKNSLVSVADTQYVAYYNAEGYVVVGKRKLGTSSWQLKQTSFKGNVRDAHNVICIIADGDGYLHLSWDHHNNPLRYAKSVAPGALEFTDLMPMTGIAESRISYPEFYKLPNGNLIFFYRDGASGNGNLVINGYDTKTKQWRMLQQNLISGEGKRNPYWQAYVDAQGTIHISWVWRESPDVASNHDLCYARSKDGGKTWEQSTGDAYALPISEASAEYANYIPQQHELINQTSMFADEKGNPFIATYWRDSGSAVPQYHLVFKSGVSWQTQTIDFRKTPFSLSGAGSKSIPISRPQIVAWNNGGKLAAALIFRDEEQGSKVSAAINKDLSKNNWQVFDLTKTSVGSWEPTYDTELWKDKRQLHLFVQNVTQVDGEGLSDMKPQLGQVLEWDPIK